MICKPNSVLLRSLHASFGGQVPLSTIEGLPFVVHESERRRDDYLSWSNIAAGLFATNPHVPFAFAQVHAYLVLHQSGFSTAPLTRQSRVSSYLTFSPSPDSTCVKYSSCEGFRQIVFCCTLPGLGGVPEGKARLVYRYSRFPLGTLYYP